MERQFLLSQADHNAINVKLEDFTTDFDDTARRIFTWGRRAGMGVV